MYNLGRCIPMYNLVIYSVGLLVWVLGTQHSRRQLLGPGQAHLQDVL